MKVNVLENISANYGVNHFLWYFYFSFTELNSAFIVLLILGIYKSIFLDKAHFAFLFKNLFSILILSFLSHKESRFLMINQAYFIFFSLKTLNFHVLNPIVL